MREIEAKFPVQEATVIDDTKAATQANIESAAVQCFEKFSIQKTTVEDICNQAAISRPTFYRFFKNKNDLLLQLGKMETTRLSANIASFKDSDKDIAEVFVDAMCFVIEECHKSKIVKFMISPKNLESTLNITFGDEHTLDGQYEGWRVLYDEAKSQGRLLTGADYLDISRWLSLIRVMLFNYVKAGKRDPKVVECMIREFVVPAIVSRSSSASPKAVVKHKSPSKKV